MLNVKKASLFENLYTGSIIRNKLPRILGLLHGHGGLSGRKLHHQKGLKFEEEKRNWKSY